MQVKTVLNRVHKIKGFVYEKVRFVGEHIEVEVRSRKGSRPICTGCGIRGPGYDTLWERHFKFVPLWAIGVVLVYAMRRVDCPQGVLRRYRDPRPQPHGGESNGGGRRRHLRTAQQARG